MASHHVLIMAGGTGGHIFPALAVARRCQAEGITVSWLGTPTGMEAKLIPSAQIPLNYISITGLRGKGFRTLLLAPWKLLLATWQAYRIIKKNDPDLILGMGGFASGPGGIAAWLLGKPLVIHEQNAIAGLTNRYLARIATKVLQAFPNVLPATCHPITVGNPIREDLSALAAPKERLLPRLNSGMLNILILGGSRGARPLNDHLPVALAAIAQPQHCHIWHQTGTTDLTNCRQRYQQLGLTATVDEFIDDMQAAYQWADLVICRAGALTIGEIATVGVASILIPYPFAVDDHQTKNAEFLVASSAAVLLPQNELTSSRLVTLLDQFLADPQQLLLMAQAAHAHSMKKATEAVVDQCLEVMSGNK